MLKPSSRAESASAPAAIFSHDTIVPDASAIFDATIATIEKNFVDQRRLDADWTKHVAAARTRLMRPTSASVLEETIDKLLQGLHSSHTEFLSNADQAYWAIEAFFSHNLDGAPVPQIGAWFRRVADRWFVDSVFEGSPAADAGLLAGDEIVSVDGRPLAAVGSFAAAAAAEVEFRRAKDGAICHVKIVPVNISVQRLMLSATTRSARIIQQNGRRIGYIHLWVGTHPAFQEAIAKAADEFNTATDAMILDLRDGFGGAGPGYVTPFFPHDDEGRPIRQRYEKPVAVLINAGTRSGKEWSAELMKAHHRATLIGMKTAGYFRAGRPFEIAPGRFLLYLAVPPTEPDRGAARSELTDPQNDWKSPPPLEGIGVEPDLRVESDFIYSAGDDPQLRAAVSYLATHP